MAHTVTIRNADVVDAAAIASVHVASWRWAYRGHLPDDTLDGLHASERESRWREVIEGGSADVLVATADGPIVGFASSGRASDDDAPPGTAELYAIYLDERTAGQGVGRALLERATAGMRSSGFARATLWVLESNERARRFYERAGWAWDGTRSSHQVQCSNMPIVRYAREL
ncbi:MAG: N-acetyltransferase family protein [Actinomycetota bacterium]